VLSIGKMSAGRADYYLSCLSKTEDEYYLSPGERPGYWLGAASPRLGLSGDVAPADFRAVLAGDDPRDGNQLVPSAGRRGRVPGFDLTFSAPKSVSVAWALADPETAARIAAAHDQAVAEAMSVFEAEVIRARRGRGGLRQIETDGTVAAGFAHRTSRAGDPQLHTHVVVANLTVDPAGRWSAPDGRRIYGWAKTVGYLYQSSLRHHLTDTLGLEWGPVRHGAADLAGYTPVQLAGFSQRRAQITAALDDAGRSSRKSAEIATLATRPAKQPAATLADLRAAWALRAADIGLPDITDLVGRPTPEPPQHHRLISDLVGQDGLTKHASSFDRRNALRAVAAALPAGAPAGEVRRVADHLLADPRVVALDASTPVGGAWFSTAEMLAVETRVLDGARGRVEAGVAVVPVAVLEQALAARPSLSEEQRAMVARLTRSGAGVEVVVGRAGAGKTFALDAARAAWEQTGTPVYGAALAARAAAELQGGSGIASETIDRLLIDTGRPGPGGGLARGSVLVVDEAGMVGTRQLDRLLTLAERADAKVVLVGDPHQLPEIDAGGAFAALTRDLPPVELVENRRQRQAWERAALDELRSGSAAAAVVAYAQAGRITVAPTADGARRAMVGDWWTARQVGGDAAMFALRRCDVDDLNNRARAHMKTQGLLTGPTVEVGGREFAVGDTVVFLRNDRRLGVKNGIKATVTGIDTPGGTITVGDGPPKVIGADYLAAGHLAHGYATTIHKAQGATVDRGFLLGSDALYREAGYTGASRARDATNLYLVANPPRPGRDDPGDAVTELAARLGVSKSQLLASDQLRPSPLRPPVEARPITELVGDAERLAARLAAHRPPAGQRQQWLEDHRGEIDQWRALQAGIAAQRHALGVAAVADPPGHLVAALGRPPTAGADRQRWAALAGRVEAYRQTHGIADGTDVLGPRPETLSQLLEWRHTQAGIDGYRHPHRVRDLDQGLAL
jgi:conjugative relaxase-like TrwC/TraI family protein